MFRRLPRTRWLIALATLLLAGLAVGFVAANGNGGGAHAASPAKNGGDPTARIEKLHQQTANRTKGNDPDDRPTLVSPEQAMQIAVQTVRGKNGQPGSGGPPAQPPPGAPGEPGKGSVGKLDHKQVQGTAVYAVVVDGTEVDVDRQSGKVVSVHAAGQ